MNEKEIIKSLKGLKEIKPRKEWALLLKSEILNAEFKEQTILTKPASKAWNILEFLPVINYQRKLAYAFATLIFMIVGIFGFAQYTMPGDLLFPIKRIAEQTQNPLQVAHNRSEDLVQIVKENKTQNLAPAISEYKASIADAAKNLTKSLAQNSDKDSIRQVAYEFKKIQDNQKQLQTLGIDIGETKEVKALDDALAVLVQSQITDLENATLADDQQKSLTAAKDLYGQGNYSDALEEILLINK